MDLSNGSFQYFRDLVLKSSGLNLSEKKQYLLETRLLPIMREHKIENLENLAKLLSSTPTGTIHSQVVESMTTQESWFFRDYHPFCFFREILEELLNREERLHIWSGACSTGQEPYSLALMIREDFPQSVGRLQITASDFSEQALSRARKGIYTQREISRGLPASLLVKGFQEEGNFWKIREEIKEQVSFIRLNLLEEWKIKPRPQIVFLRNVLIYFSLHLKKKIFINLAELIPFGGYLFLGASETPYGISEAFQKVPREKTFCYQRV